MPDVTERSLAIDGGRPVREHLLPYGRQSVDEEDITAVVDVLRSDWLTTGPAVVAFEERFASFVGTTEAVAVSNGTAALHAAMFALEIGPGDEVIVPAMTFAATANCVIYQGGTPVIVDVDPESLLIDPSAVEAAVTPATRAVIAVDYAGQPCDYDVLRMVTERHGLHLVADACHALGGSDRDRPVGSLADLSTFSFHPVKHMTTGEGGMISTNNPKLAHRMRIFRNHGITTDHRQREEKGSWFYEMEALGYNYRLSDMQCALGMRQLEKVRKWIDRRREISARYDSAFQTIEQVQPLSLRSGVQHAYHLYVIRLNIQRLSVSRADVFSALRAEGIGVNVHYVPVHRHPFYREQLGTGDLACPAAEAAYECILSLPMFHSMTDADVDDVIEAVSKIIAAYRV